MVDLKIKKKNINKRMPIEKIPFLNIHIFFRYWLSLWKMIRKRGKVKIISNKHNVERFK